MYNLLVLLLTPLGHLLLQTGSETTSKFATSGMLMEMVDNVVVGLIRFSALAWATSQRNIVTTLTTVEVVVGCPGC